MLNRLSGLLKINIIFKANVVVRSDLIKPSLHDGILAPTSTQRLRFVRWLHIWAKERIEIPARTGLLIDEYNSVRIMPQVYMPSK